jgi:hypothetical protein
VEMIRPSNPEMAAGGWYRPVQYPGVVAGKGFSTTYGYNFVISSKAPKEKQEVLHSMYKFIMSDLADCWADTAPFPLARKTGWTDSPAVQSFPHVDEILMSRDRGVYLPRTVVVAELADALHACVQKIMLNNGDIKACLDEAAATTDRATEDYKKA